MKKKAIIASILLILSVIIYFQLQNSKNADPRGSLYAGSLACVKCHHELSISYLHTAHFIASSPASIKTVHGSFSRNLNVFEIDTHQQIIMEKLDSGLFQTYYSNGIFKERHRFDVVLGGIKGESYLYWKGNGLNQLPISYFTKQDKWLMSPRFAPGLADFSRIITSRCMECHASYIGDKQDEVQRLNTAEQFDKGTLVYGIDCERCHGPGANHVDFQTANPDIKTAKFIASYRTLPRARRIDMCAVCHSGNKSEMIRSTFFFLPGDTLANFKLQVFYSPVIRTSYLDVHGNQVQLLQGSKCFISSKMDCATCHDTHQNQRGNIALFTQKCLGCHSTANHNYCKMSNTSNAQLVRSNCIQCHMPALATRVIISPNMDSTFTADILVRTHHIAIYPQEAKKILMMIEK